MTVKCSSVLKLFFGKLKTTLYKRRVLLCTGLVFKSENILLANIQQKNGQFCVIEFYRPVISLDLDLVLLSAKCTVRSIAQITEISSFRRSAEEETNVHVLYQ